MKVARFYGAPSVYLRLLLFCHYLLNSDYLINSDYLLSKSDYLVNSAYLMNSDSFKTCKKSAANVGTHLALNTVLCRKTF